LIKRSRIKKCRERLPEPVGAAISCLDRGNRLPTLQLRWRRLMKAPGEPARLKDERVLFVLISELKISSQRIFAEVNMK
jgi:hypothetical protein